MDKNKMSKLNDSDLEEVNGGLILASRTVYNPSVHSTKGQTAVMSGDTEADPMLLGGKDQGVPAGTIRKAGRQNNPAGTIGKIPREQFL